MVQNTSGTLFSNVAGHRRWALLAATVGLMLTGCATDGPSSTGGQAEVAPRDVEKLYVIDCLLPPEVRQLGQSINYLAPRRPMKTTAIDCEIRGGEYVAFDRADYSTALKVWLPKAQEGNAEAQNYVGEIYERGIGSQPDFQVAAVWYKKAAEQGSSRAQINLGNLYEKGLGVERDLAAAMSWFRKASGLTVAGLQFVSSVEVAADKAALQSLRDEVEQQNQQIADARQQLEATRGSLGKEQQRAKEQKKQLADARRQLDQERAKPKPATGAVAPDVVKKVQSLELKIKAQEGEAAQQQARVEQLQRADAEYQAKLRELESRTQENATLRQQVGAQTQQIAALAAQVTATQGQLQGERSRAQQMQQELAQERTRMEQERTRLAQTSGADKSVLQKMEQQMRDREAAFNEKQVLLSKLEQEALTYKQQFDALQRAKEKAVDVPPSIEIISPPLLVTRGLPTIAVNTPVAKRDITGRIKAPAGITSFSVNTVAQTLTPDGNFNISIPLTGPETRVVLVAVDRKSRVAKMDLMISAPNTVPVEPAAGIGGQVPATWKPQGVEFGT